MGMIYFSDEDVVRLGNGMICGETIITRKDMEEMSPRMLECYAEELGLPDDERTHQHLQIEIQGKFPPEKVTV